MNELQNPARRLHRILDQVRTSNVPEEKAIDVWADLLELTTMENDRPRVLHRLGLLIGLFGEVERALEGLQEEKKRHYGDSLRSLRRIVSYDLLFKNWQETQKVFDGRALKDMVLLAVDLEERGYGVSDLDPAELDQLRADVLQLIDEVLESDLEENLRRFIVQQLRRIADALLDYRLQGSSALVDVGDLLTGVMTSRVREHAEQLKDDKHSQMYGRVWELLLRFEAYLAKIETQLPQITAAAKEYLGPAALKMITGGNGGG